jgi:hypothetical protein
MRSPAIPAPTPIPAFAPVPSVWELELWADCVLALVFEVGFAVEVGVGVGDEEVETVDDAGNIGGEVLLSFRMLHVS